jgi:HD-GYP domain-containing protein (c-di-GMP phosphodiesterase class II)
MSSIHHGSLPAADTAPPAAGKADQSQEQHLARGLINCLFVLLKTAYIHQQNNAALHRPLANIQETIYALFAATQDDTVTLSLASNAFFLNQMLVRLDSTSFQNAEFLRIICGELRIGAFEFYDGCDEQAFRTLMVSIVEAVRGDTGTTARLTRDFGTIYLQPPPSTANKELLDRRQFILHSYALVLMFTSQMLACWPRGRRRPLSGVKRTVQSLLDIIEADSVTLLGLTQLQDYRWHLATHLVHVTILSLLIGRRTGLPRPELVRLGMTALLHEIGAIDLPQGLLEHTDGLSDAEKTALCTLPLLSVRRLLEFPRLGPDSLPRIVAVFENRAHIPTTHSYNAQLPADVRAQLIAVADAYDHLTTSRLGHTALRPDQALGVLLRNQEGRFADWAVQLLVAAIGYYPIGTLVELDTGELGIVSGQPEEGTPVNRPQIRLIAMPDGTSISTRIVVDLCETDAAGRPLRSIHKTVAPDLVPVNVPYYFLD